MKNLKTLLAIIVIATLFAFTTSNSEKNNSEGYNVGDIATDFSLKNVDGNMVSLADYTEAKGFIVIFTCNTCPVSVRNEDRILALDKKYKDQGFPVIAINPNNPAVQPGDSYELMKVRAKEKGFTFPYLFDDGQKIYPQYGATATPHVYLLQKEEEGLVVKYIGGIDDSSRNENNVKVKYLENAVDALLASKEIEVTKTRAIGCSIKK
ncbi:thioredoxin family protein [Aureibaculum sp. 2210JD6-5]|uniref:thioredoxin family protein n=1 Tax=Aureibaculum sp. 2210JD6-5 TaxID=3103957 RepID=UPI002AAED4B9|nr:thioredoxin family protein [Aureibaculum sp. 2210JD6-5]MDY7394712.1 thioredoxin family protein [Aureibaculum sp. 2210JD6-5]